MKARMGCTRAMFALLVIGFLGPTSVWADWQVINLHPDLPEAIGSWAAGVSAGRQVGWIDRPDGYRHAYLWNGSAESWVDLHPSWAAESFAQGIAGGQQVGSVRFVVEGPQGPEQHEHAGIWSGTAESWVSLNPPLIPAPWRSVAYSTDGVQQGGFVELDWDHASIWNGSAETWTDLHPPGASRSAVFGVYDGRQVGFATIDAIHAALWSGTVESYVDLNPPAAVRSWGYGIWGNEQVGMATVLDLPELVHASLWRGTADSWVDLHPENLYPTGWSYARGVCRGWQVGWLSPDGPTAPPRASLWHGSAGSYVDLHALLPDGYDASQAWGIDVAGDEIWVVGYAHNAVAGRDEAVMWYLPEPGTLSLLALGGLTVALAGRSKRKGALR